MKLFNTLSISKEMLDNLSNLKYERMTDIQEKSIPSILKGSDVMGQAKTGSGKTAAFGIGLLENIDLNRYRIQGLVLCPTRELAEQVTGELRRIARARHNIKLLTITGGFPQRKQEQSLAHKAHIVIGTPGRLLRLLQREKLILDEIKMVVLDEADRMLDMGFIDQIQDIFKYAPAKRQTLCFSATFPEEIKKLCRTILNKPKEITVETQHDLKIINQYFYTATPAQKIKTTLALLKIHRPDSTLIFCNTKESCKRVRKELNSAGLHSLEIHGDLEQKERTEVLIRFTNGSSRVLIATDVAARGLDINSLGAVINFDLPFETETYIHRIGRTGRAGKKGLALSLMNPKEDFRLQAINEFTKNQFTASVLKERVKDGNGDLEPLMVTLSINGGRKNKISAGDILGALTANNGISGKDVGKIDRLDYITFVAVKRGVMKKAVKILKEGTIKGRSFLVLVHD